jgi:spoIIIJ-associated protein
MTVNQSDSKHAEAIERAREFLIGVLERMEIHADVEVFEREDKIVLDIDCDDVERIIGRRGQIMEALQHLVSKVSYRDRMTGEGKPIVVDAGGYREKQVEKLIELAERMGAKALKSGTIIELSPMSAHDRRIVHMALADMEGVSTRSEGEGEERRVLIVPGSSRPDDEYGGDRDDDDDRAGD